MAINTLLLFYTTYLCEFGFSALTNIQNKKRDLLLSVEQEIRLYLSLIPSQIGLVCKQHQAHVLN